MPHDERSRRLFDRPELLIKLPPELLLRSKDRKSPLCIMKGLPASFVIWLYSRLNVKDSVWYSLKQDSALCCVDANNEGAGRGGSYCLKTLSSAGDAECSTGMKGWHLHAFGPFCAPHPCTLFPPPPLLAPGSVFNSLCLALLTKNIRAMKGESFISQNFKEKTYLLLSKRANGGMKRG